MSELKKTKTREYIDCLEQEGVPKDLARNAATVLRVDFLGDRTERGQRVVTRAYQESIKDKE